MKNGMIEVLRFIFSLGIIIFHGQLWFGVPIGTEKFILCGGGAIGVEYFFVVSGYLFAKAMKKYALSETISNSEIGKVSFSYVLRKFKGIFPEHVFAFVVGFVSIVVIAKDDFISIVRKLILAVPDFFLN